MFLYDYDNGLILIPQMRAQQLATLKTYSSSDNNNSDFTSSGAFYGIIGGICGLILILFIISAIYFKEKVFCCIYQNDDKMRSRGDSQYQAMKDDKDPEL